MRDYIVVAIILGAAPFALFDPYFGVLVWNWVAFFNPHRYTWGFAYTFPVAQVIALPTIVGIFFSRDKTNRPFFVREVVILLLFWIWCAITLAYCGQNYELATHFEEGLFRFQEVSKILLMTFITILLVSSRKKFYYLILVIALSFGIRALIAGWWGITSGGQSKVYGPPDTFIADNNDFGLALNMALPMLFFLAGAVEDRRLRLLLRTCFVATIISILLTYSRGALLGLVAILLYTTLKSRYKVIGMGLLAFGAFLVLTFAPAAWMDRMNNFAEGNLDRSAQERITTWQFTLNFVHAYPVTGGGMELFEDTTLKQRYAPEGFSDILLKTGPHSIYFQALGEQGFVGFLLFISLLGSCMFTLGKVRKHTRDSPSLGWMVPYTHMLQVGLVGYAVSGAFLGRAYFDLYYTLVACTSILSIIYKRESLAVAEPQTTVATADEPEPELSRT